MQATEFLDHIKGLIVEGHVLVSSHGYDELADDNIFVKDILKGMDNAVTVEYYPDYVKGPCILILIKDIQNNPVHVVWGISQGESGPAVLVTAYRPDPERWNDDFVERRK